MPSEHEAILCHVLKGETLYDCKCGHHWVTLDRLAAHFTEMEALRQARTHWNGTTWVEPPVSPESLWLQAEPPDGEAMEPRPERTFHNSPQQAGTSQPGDVNATDAEVTMLVETAEWTINRARRSRGLGEPPDGEAMGPAPPLDPEPFGKRPNPSCRCYLPGFSDTDAELCAGLPTLAELRRQLGIAAPHAFNRAVDASVARRQAISNQRGNEYQDTWALPNIRATILEATLRAIITNYDEDPWTPEELRLALVAALCDVKDSRLIGPWKLDTMDDGGNYRDAYASWREEYENPEATA